MGYARHGQASSQPVCAQARRACHRDSRGRRGPDDTVITKQTSDLELAAPMRIDKKMGAVTGFVAAIPAQINSPRTHHRVARLHETFPRGILSILLCSRDRNHRPNCFFAHSVLAASRISCQLANAELAEMKASHGASGIALKSSGAFTEYPLWSSMSWNELKDVCLVMNSGFSSSIIGMLWDPSSFLTRRCNSSSPPKSNLKSICCLLIS